MKALLPFSVLLFSTHAEAALSEDAYCFRSDGKAGVKMEFHTYSDVDTKLSFGSVRYGRSTEAIPLVAANSSFEIPPKAANPVSTTTWIEIVNGKINGTYELTAQGGLMLDMIYTNKSNGKKVSFYFDSGAEISKDGMCVWSE